MILSQKHLNDSQYSPILTFCNSGFGNYNCLALAIVALSNHRVAFHWTSSEVGFISV